MRRLRIGLPQKLVLMVVVVCALFTVILVRLETGVFVASLRSQRIGDMEQLLRYAGEHLDLKAQHINQLTNTCSQIAELAEGGDEEIVEALRLFVDNNIDTVRSAFFVNSQGRVYASRQVSYDVLVQTMGYDVPRQLAREVRTAYATVSSEPYRSSMFTDRTVAFMRAVHNTMGMRIGTVLLEIDLSKLVEGFTSATQLEMHPFLLLSQRGNAIYENRTNGQVLGYEDTPLTVLLDLPQGWSTYRSPLHQSYQAYSYACRNVRWRLVLLLDESLLLASVPQLMAQITQVSLLLFSLLAVVVSVVALSLALPIRKLARSMRSVSSDDANLPHVRRIRRGDEIGDLYSSFEIMIGRIEALLKRQKETERARHAMELKVLQSQISPHFLYNTLNTIGSLAAQGRTQEVPKTTAALIRLLAMSMDKMDELIPLAKELDTLEAYFNIQRMRYGDRFGLSFLVPDDLLSCHVPKLILQPLVENVIFHGFSDGRSDGVIVVEARISGEMLLLSVVDNGVGMPAEMLVTVLEEEAAEVVRRKKGGFRSIGLRNIQDRIQLRFGDAYGLDITSTAGVGTMVVVCLPILREAPE